ncbi:bifunctional adenosylcobinamide kinase/adenosylcobinamide-phosphate guanylyltransferase [Gilvimarinus polysaccharolyticus]|uniref:bifunctional adenosylcobinamide kinase/adenosylcobinamide-phosphate guanylyltransferase n=1 Tax=Gilvimarinus polysaccharolyticus TaxID=863921 RepID=UPI0006735576|nr:bifunctional adenosylcobinamide kinase/adenosylcobinamide-phosphate guanylyltransferase [Gilvimarinus polysaccharolyticus]
MQQLILGGARSGKSRLAQQRAETWREQTGGALYYLATAGIGDDEMRARIAQHRADRDGQWQTLEEPVALAATLKQFRGQPVCILVDCLTLWISNCLHQGLWLTERDALLAELDIQSEQAAGPELIFVSNEVGSGIVPLGQLSRDFVDASGWLHQALAARFSSVTLVVAGLPLALK